MDVNIKNVFTNIEKAFNIAGSIPIVSLVSGTLRILAGKVQILAGAVIAATGCINFLINPSEKWANMSKMGSEFMIHGALNSLRGFGEALLCASTIIGNVLLLIPNMVKDDMFSPYFAYGTLDQSLSRRFAF